MTEDEEFAALPDVHAALRHYERNPKWDYGSGDLARAGKALVDASDAVGDLDGLKMTVTLSIAQTQDGAPFFDSTEAPELARVVETLQRLQTHRGLFVRLASYKPPKGKRGTREPARQKLVLRLAWTWFNSGRGRPSITHDPVTDTAGGRFLRACIFACRPCPRPCDWR